MRRHPLYGEITIIFNLTFVLALRKEDSKMIAGHLRVIGKYYHIILSFKDSQGVRRTPTILTGIQLCDHQKKAALRLLKEYRMHFDREEYEANGIRRLTPNFTLPFRATVDRKELNSGVKTETAFNEFLINHQYCIAKSTYGTYQLAFKKIIIPYFKNRKLTVKRITSEDVSCFYHYLRHQRNNGNNTLKKYQGYLSKAFEYAISKRYIESNPVASAEKIRKVKSNVGKVLSKKDLRKILNVVKDSKMELPVYLGLVYGMRRGEVLGLRWKDIDFERKSLTVANTRVHIIENGKRLEVDSKRAKTDASLRTYPLLPSIEKMLKEIKAKQKQNRRVLGEKYIEDAEGHVILQDNGEILKLDKISRDFHQICLAAEVEVIRFHDLRHCCATLLAENKVDIKFIQEWLGHKDINVTANIYTHLGIVHKLSTASTFNYILETL